MTFLYSRGRFSSRVGQPVRNGETIERRSRTRSRHARARTIEELENRMLLSGSVQFDHVLFGPPTAAPNVAITPATGSRSPYGYSPAEIRSAYGVDSIQLGSVVGDGSGQTIAIVDAYDDPGLVSSTASNFLTSDLHLFDVQFGLPDPPSFLKLDEYGGTNYPSTDPRGPGNSWAVEESLDVEWAHVIAPEANIVLVEANNACFSGSYYQPLGGDLVTAVGTAAKLPGVSVVSMSWGISEGCFRNTVRPAFHNTRRSHGRHVCRGGGRQWRTGCLSGVIAQCRRRGWHLSVRPGRGLQQRNGMEPRRWMGHGRGPKLVRIGAQLPGRSATVRLARDAGRGLRRCHGSARL